MTAGLAYALGIRPALLENREKREKNAAFGKWSRASPWC